MANESDQDIDIFEVPGDSERVTQVILPGTLHALPASMVSKREPAFTVHAPTEEEAMRRLSVIMDNRSGRVPTIEHEYCEPALITEERDVEK